MYVKEVMKPAITIDEDVSLEKLSELLHKQEISSLIYMKGSKIKGIITEDDIIENYGKGVRASQIMEKQVVTITTDTTIQGAARKMEKHKVSVLPVLENDKLVGIVSAKDLLPALREGGDEFILD